MEWVADRIGEEYKKWENGDKVFIASPTGSGKTHFIIKQLLPHLVREGKSMLYLVNRKILKEQMKGDIGGIPQEHRTHIRIESYQHIEEKFCDMKYHSEDSMPKGYYSLGYDSVENFLKGYDCVICDECHYFLADSNYNTNTIISFHLINKYFNRKIRIFMSATIAKIQNYISDLEVETGIIQDKSRFYGFTINRPERGLPKSAKKPYIYKMSSDYSYAEIKVINKDDIVDLVTEGTDKWLIFVDTIDFGEKLEIKLREGFKGGLNSEDEKNQDVVLLSSDYDKREESLREVDSVVSKNRFKAKVIISTSVMDNGINIKDSDLRSMIIIADNEVEFIQMLGRKRKDKQHLRLYIVRQPRVYFSIRQQQVQKCLKIAERYYESFERYVKKPLLQERESDMINGILQSEAKLVIDQHKITLQKIADGEIPFKEAAKIFLVYNGCIYLNLLAMKNLDNLNVYYQNVLERFDADGEDAFVKEQLEWLGKTEEEINAIIEDSSTTTVEKYRKYVLEKINEILDKPKERDEIIVFKKEISDKLRYLVESVEKENPERKKVVDSVRRNDRPLSRKDMEFLNRYCGLPFRIEVEDSTYTFQKIEN